MSNKEKQQKAKAEAVQAEQSELCEEPQSGSPEEEMPKEENAQNEAEKESEVSEKEKELSDALALAEDYKRKWYAVTAEYENYRRRTKSDCAKRYAEGRADVVSKLFPIADNLGRALAACSDEKTAKGIGMVVKAFEKILEEERIEEIDPLHEPFDAEKMEAIMAVEPEEGEESGTVREVYRKGYMQDGKVLRFAQVVVVR